MRVAVTSTNVCVKDPRKPDEAVRGKFLYSPATAFPPDCVQSRAMVCNSDADCRNANLPDAQNWVCTGSSAENLYTCDVPPEIIESTGRDDGYEGDVLRSVQSECRYRCSRDNPAQCARVFGSSDACAKTSVGANPSMCDGGTCSTDACISNPLLKSSVDCNSACRGQECTSVCEDLIGDAAACASRCTASSGSLSMFARRFPHRPVRLGLLVRVELPAKSVKATYTTARCVPRSVLQVVALHAVQLVPPSLRTRTSCVA